MGQQEGLFTVGFGAVSFFLLPRTPRDTFLLTEEEKDYVVATLHADGTMAKDDADDNFSWHQVIKAVQSPHVLLMAIAGFTSGTMLYALA